MLDNTNNQECLELLDAPLRDSVPPVEPLDAELQSRIFKAIRTEPTTRKKALVFRRYVIATAAAAAGILLVISLLLINRSVVNKPEGPLVYTPPDRTGNLLKEIPKTRLIIDKSLTAVTAFTTDSAVQEMRDMAQDASNIGAAMFTSLPISVSSDSPVRWWTLLE
ncbi:MAG: hypothetical protein GY794_09825 [bacterium]|nr:hypothetical protein [bacterium]